MENERRDALLNNMTTKWIEKNIINHSAKMDYIEAVKWIAFNDEPEDVVINSIAGYISTSLVADIFMVDRKQVAKDVRKFRS